MTGGQARRGETGKDSHGWGWEGSLVMESFQTPFIVCLRTGALQEQDEPAPLELLGALQRNPDAKTEQDPITTRTHPLPLPPPRLCLRTLTRQSKGSVAVVKALFVITFCIFNCDKLQMLFFFFLFFV